MKIPPLPPLVGPVVAGSVTWDRLSDIDYTTVGYLLCCHLVLENYIEAYIQANVGANLSVENARLTFAQKLSILDSWKLPDRFNFMPSLKHLNSLRNKLGHNIQTTISESELLPLIQFLETVGEKKLDRRDAISVLEVYTGTVGAYMASAYVLAKEGRIGDPHVSFEKWAANHLDITRVPNAKN
jgi:hypothetical protein